jgi:hypothetical protein
LTHPEQVGPEHILRRVSPTEIRSLRELYPTLAPGELLDTVPRHSVFREYWPAARSDSFGPPDAVHSLRESKSY